MTRRAISAEHRLDRRLMLGGFGTMGVVFGAAAIHIVPWGIGVAAGIVTISFMVGLLGFFGGVRLREWPAVKEPTGPTTDQAADLARLKAADEAATQAWFAS